VQHGRVTCLRNGSEFSERIATVQLDTACRDVSGVRLATPPKGFSLSQRARVILVRRTRRRHARCGSVARHRPTGTNRRPGALMVCCASSRRPRPSVRGHERDAGSREARVRRPPSAPVTTCPSPPGSGSTFCVAPAAAAVGNACALSPHDARPGRSRPSLAVPLASGLALPSSPASLAAVATTSTTSAR
jgi:hypothetical protein